MEVYKITCKINGKIYIGSTTYTKEIRWKKGHLNMAHRKNTPNDNLLYVDIKKYGENNFEIETLEVVYRNKERTV